MEKYYLSFYFGMEWTNKLCCPLAVHVRWVFNELHICAIMLTFAYLLNNIQSFHVLPCLKLTKNEQKQYLLKKRSELNINFIWIEWILSGVIFSLGNE